MGGEAGLPTEGTPGGVVCERVRLLLPLLEFNRGYFQLLMTEVTDEMFVRPSVAGGKTMQWVVGHLVVVNDGGVALLGGTRSCPPEWQSLFGPRSSPAALTTEAPGKAALVAAFDAGVTRLSQAAASVTVEQLDARHPVPMPILRRMLPTVGELLGHLMTTHLAGHLGQISVLRREFGLKELF